MAFRGPVPVVVVDFTTYQKSGTRIFAALRHGSVHTNNSAIYNPQPRGFSGVQSIVFPGPVAPCAAGGEPKH